MARYRMPVLCSVCGKLIRMSWANRPGVESHGYCKACAKAEYAKLAAEKEARDAR